MFSVRKRSANVAAANVLSVRKRSDSNNKSGFSDDPRKAPSRNGNQPHVMVRAYVNIEKKVKNSHFEKIQGGFFSCKV